ncbi:MAG: transcriptional repressor LexA [Gemmatimonadaceae bacterium]
MHQPLTNVERKVYQYLLDFLTENTYQPSVREIGRKFRIKSTKTVSEVLQALANKGYIERDPSRSRGVRLLGYEGSTRTRPVPYYGKIAAGQPALLPENRKGYITVDRRFIPCDEAFFLKIDGDSMIGRGIFNGDYALICPTESADEGQVIAARLGDTATVKTLTRRDGTIVLEPANPAEQEIVVGADEDFSVLGTVCGIFRPYQEIEEAASGTEQ